MTRIAQSRRSKPTLPEQSTLSLYMTSLEQPWTLAAEARKARRALRAQPSPFAALAALSPQPGQARRKEKRARFLNTSCARSNSCPLPLSVSLSLARTLPPSSCRLPTEAEERPRTPKEPFFVPEADTAIRRHPPPCRSWAQSQALNVSIQPRNTIAPGPAAGCVSQRTLRSPAPSRRSS